MHSKSLLSPSISLFLSSFHYLISSHPAQPALLLHPNLPFPLSSFSPPQSLPSSSPSTSLKLISLFLFTLRDPVVHFVSGSPPCISRHRQYTQELSLERQQFLLTIPGKRALSTHHTHTHIAKNHCTLSTYQRRKLFTQASYKNHQCGFNVSSCYRFLQRPDYGRKFVSKCIPVAI